MICPKHGEQESTKWEPAKCKACSERELAWLEGLGNAIRSWANSFPKTEGERYRENWDRTFKKRSNSR